MPKYKTNLIIWRNELQKELGRKVLWGEVIKNTDLAYSTLQKHRTHAYTRPDFAAASKICDFFRANSRQNLRRVTPLDYFKVIEDEQI